MKKKGENISLILTVIIILLAVYIGFSIVNAKVNDEQLYIFDRMFLIVVSDSMTPEIEVGDFVLAKKVHIATVKVGDNAVFIAPEDHPMAGQKIIHKVISTQFIDNQTVIVTQGVKAGTIPDSPITADRFLGIETWQSSLVGDVILFLSVWTNWIFIAVVVIIIAVIIALIKTIAKQMKESNTNESENNIKKDKKE